MRFASNKKLYLPAFTLIAVVLLLLIMIAISTVRTLSHQRLTALAFMNNQGITLMHSLEAAVVTGMRMPMWGDDSVKILIDEFGKNKNLAYIYIFDKTGVIIHASPASLEGTPSPWRPELEDDARIVSRLVPSGSGGQVYEMAKRFHSPLSMPYNPMPMHRMAPHGGNSLSMSDHHKDSTLVLGLSMSDVEAAHHSDLQHAAIMGATLLALGTGAFFFIFVIQNYYLVARALDKNRDYLKLVMASMSNGLLSIDGQGNLVTINNAAQQMLGINHPFSDRTNLRTILDFDTTGIEKTLADGTPVIDREIVFDKPSGSPFGAVVLSISISPIIAETGESASAGAVIILRDLTEIKQLQEKVRRSEKLAAIGELAAGIAHEVRNPLSSIRGFAQFLMRVLKEQPREREYAQLMVKEVDRINTVVTNLLSFARPVHPEPEPTDMSRLLRHVVRLVQEDAELRGIEIKMAVSPELSPVVIDANQITQVLLNLVLNALQAVSEKGRILVGAIQPREGLLEIYVEDNGPGIPPELIKRVFDPFFTTKEKGTGLGMAIVHMMVENHGGEIRVVSPLPGQNAGCRMTIHLPVPVATDGSHSEQ